MDEITYMGIQFKKPVYPNVNHGYIGTLCANKINQKLKNETNPCEVCGRTEGIEKHHENYDKPFEVRWLCKRHHLDIHKIFRQIKKKNELKLF